MASFDAVNYSLRPSKTIQRQIVFGGIQVLQAELNLQKMVYVGFGSIWFTDFVMAHKALGIRDMVSMESDEIGYRRARFNAPYATVRVLRGWSTELLPELYRDRAIRRRPWIVWLDYDRGLDEDIADDVRSVVENSPPSTILLLTVDGAEKHYGNGPRERLRRLGAVLGDVVPNDLSKNCGRGEAMQETVADLAMKYMESVAENAVRPGGFVGAFRLIYRDKAPMVTVGGVLPAPEKVEAAESVVADQGWRCRAVDRIVAPHLTVREALALQKRLPKRTRLTRAQVRRMGFDLHDEQIAAFETYYREYPAYARIVT